jgi:hypothetical protein
MPLLGKLQLMRMRTSGGGCAIYKLRVGNQLIRTEALQHTMTKRLSCKATDAKEYSAKPLVTNSVEVCNFSTTPDNYRR